jgi:hypothetical protein
MSKKTKEQFIPRFNYITLTAKREGEAKVYDADSNISEYQTVLQVGDHVQDLKPGDKIKFERTAFPMTNVPIHLDHLEQLNALQEKGLDADEHQAEFVKITETAPTYAVPIMKDDLGQEFLWVSDRAVMFKFE